MRFRKLRIAWSALCGIACVLLIVLWVRSHNHFDDIGWAMAAQGKLYLSPKVDFFPINEKGAAVETYKHFDGKITTIHVWNGKLTPRAGTGPVIPYWPLVLVTSLLTVAPLIRRRFSLRTLLIATTLVALVLGLVAWSSRRGKPQVQMGDVAPVEVGGNSSHGDGIGIEDDAFKGKFVLVVYWSLDDVNREQWESKLRDIRTSYLKNSDFRILSICVSTDVDAWMKYLDQAPPLDVDDHKVKIYSDRLWWQLHVMDWKPPEAVVDQLPTAHLIGQDGRFIAVRVPLKDLESTVAANVHKP